MIHPKTTVFCCSIGSYPGQLTKRKSYTVEEVNSENVRIKNDQDKLKWYSAVYFELEKQPEIRSISIDDYIGNPACDIIEITIELEDDRKYWTRFTTPEYLNKLLKEQLHITTTNLIVVSELTDHKINKVIRELDEHNELLGNCRAY